MENGIKTLIGVVVLLILLANLAPVALVAMFNATIWNATTTGIPGWVSPVLGILGVVGFIFLILKATE